MGRSFRLGRIFGIDVKIHWSWILVFFLFASLLKGYFARALADSYPGLFEENPLGAWILGVAAVLLLFLCVTIHELGHSLMAKKFGMRVSGITLFFFGGVSSIENLENISAKEEFFIAFVGPFVNILLALAFFGAEHLLLGGRVTELSASVLILLQYLMYMNFVLALFNMLPIFPLDGGRVLVSTIRFFRVSASKAQKIASSFGVVASGALLAISTMSVFIGHPLNPAGGAWIFPIAMFLFMTNLVMFILKKRVRRKNDSWK